MPFGVIEIVGADGTGVGEGDGVETGGVGDVGVVDEVPLEQAAHVRIEKSTRARIGVRYRGATGLTILSLTERGDRID
jgi:hypothetical protein